MRSCLFVLALFGCVGNDVESEPRPLLIAGDPSPAPIGSIDDGVVRLDPRLLESLPSDAPYLRTGVRDFALDGDNAADVGPLWGPLDLVVPTEHGTWKIALAVGRPEDSSAAALDCAWTFHTNYSHGDACWGCTSLFGGGVGGQVHSWYLFKRSETCGLTAAISTWRSCVPCL